MKRTHGSSPVLPRAYSRAPKLATALALAALLLPAQSHAQLVRYSLVRSFQGAAGLDGASPYSGLVFGRDGALYGTTWGGGFGAGGTVFRVNTDGSGYAILRSFTNAPDGGSPYAGLIQGWDGALYGTTYFGGISNAGTVFKLRTDGTGYQILRSFASSSSDAAYPWAGLVQGRDGWLYGTTLKGGDNNLGTVFRMNTNGTAFSVLHSFVSNFQDGYTPYAGLIQGHDGALYGVTDQGGSTLFGTVFRISTDGNTCQVIYTFRSGTGYWPRGALTQRSDGTLYGTTYSGGPTNGGGVVYRVGTNGLDYAVLHAFPGGANPWSSLVQAADGALCGATEWGGNNNGGVVFRLRPDGSEYSVLHNFAANAGADGSHPVAGLISRAGVLYGTTLSGGFVGAGTVYRLTYAPTLRISPSAQGPRVTVTGFAGQSCRLDATTNCTDWFPRANLVLTNGVADFLETDAGGSPSRLYRAAAQ